MLAQGTPIAQASYYHLVNSARTIRTIRTRRKLQVCSVHKLSERAGKVVADCAQLLLGPAVAAAIAFSSFSASASLPASDLSSLSYDLNLKKRDQKSSPDRGFEASLELDEEMFVPDAWNAMQRYSCSCFP